MFGLFEISNFGIWISIQGRLGLPDRKAYSPEGAKTFIDVVLINILSVGI